MLIDVSSFIPAAVLLGLVFLPALLAVGIVSAVKRAEARAGRRAPIKEKLLHQAGSQARKQADEAADGIVQRVLQLLIIGPLAMLAILLPRVQWSRLQFGWSDWLICIGATVWIVFMVRDLLHIRAQRKSWQDGMHGEMATAQALDRLQSRGCMVFHDLPGDRGNIDHVIVAPNAVFAVETKWRSKRGDGKKAAQVWFDGKALEFPVGHRDGKSVDQALACASELSKYIKGKTGEPVKVVPVVALPGWYVTNRANPVEHDAVAINPKLAYQLLDRPGTPIPQAQRNRIIHALTERYPELET